MADTAPATPPRWRRALAQRRWRVLLALVLLAVATRIALPTVLRRVVVSQADQALVGRVEIDDVDLALLTGGITVHGLRVYAEEAPPPGSASPPRGSPTEHAPEATSASPDAPSETRAAAEPSAAPTPSPGSSAADAATITPTPETTTGPPAEHPSAAPSPVPEAGSGPPGSAPVLSAKLLTVDLAYRPLLHRIVEIERIALDGVAVSLDRAKDGTLVLPAAVPAAEPTPEPSPAGPGWGVLIRSVSLHDGHIGFRDFAIGDPPQRVDVTLPAVDASQLALLITQRGLQPGTLALDAGIRGGRLHLDVKIETAEAGPTYESRVVLTDVPIADSRLYLPKVGWSGLTGLLDADLVHRFESQGAHTVRGTAALRDLDVRVAGLDDAALAWRKLAVDVAGIDFVAQHADVTSVALDGARVVTRPAGPVPLPVLQGLMVAAVEKAEALASPAATTTPSAAPSGAASTPPAAVATPAATGPSVLATAAAPSQTTTGAPAPPTATSTTRPSPVASPVPTDTSAAASTPGTIATASGASASPSAPSTAATSPSPVASAPPTVAATAPSPAASAPPTAAATSPSPVASAPSAVAATAGVPSAPSPSPAGVAPPSATVTSAGGAKPWTWRIGKLHVTDGHVQALGGDGPVGIGVDAEAAPLTSAVGKPAAIRLALAPSSGGTVEVTGNLVPAPLAFDGRLVVNALQLAPLSQPVATAVTRLVQSGALSADLTLAAGATASAPPSGVRASGTIDLTDLAVTGEDPAAFAIRWKSLAVAIADLSAPGVLGTPGQHARSESAADASTPSGPIEIAFGSIALTRPDLTLTRFASGIVLPTALGGSGTAPAAANPAKAAPPARGGAAPSPQLPTPRPTPAAATAAPESTAPAAPAPTAVRVRADRISIAKMRLVTTDTTVQPFFRSTLDPVDLDASAVAWPGPAAKDVKLVAKSADGGVLTVTGDVAAERTRLTVKVADLPLAPFNPYAATSGYGVSGGTARVDSTIAVTGNAYDTRSRLVLHELGVTSGEGDALFASTFGMPLDLALSLLTDLQGNIVLDLPIAGDAAGMRTDLGTIVANALTRAILNAVTSPLKLIGAVTRVGEKPAALAPRPLVFLAGRATLADGESAKLAPLGGLVARAPGLRLHLRAEVGDDDRRWLREQALRATLEAESGVLGSVRHLAERGARKAALAALTARAEGKPGDVPAEHRDWFEAAVAEQTVDDAALRVLADARIAEVRAQLASGHGVDAARLVVDPPRLDGAAQPVVAVGLGSPAPTPQSAAPSDAPSSGPARAPSAAPSPTPPQPAPPATRAPRRPPS